MLFPQSKSRGFRRNYSCGNRRKIKYGQNKRNRKSGIPQFVDRLRTFEKSMGREEAVKHTVDTCIGEGILRDFLLKYREEAIEMRIFEYDEEETLRQLGQQSYEGGVAAGIEQGREEGKLVGEEQRLFRQVCTKLKKGKTPEVIAEELEEDLSPIRSICEAAEEFAPEYDWKKVMEKTGAYIEKKC